MTDLKCWRCGFDLASLSLPLSRQDQCPDCFVDLHACRMCTQFDKGVPRQCREDGAEEVKEKERANFCDWFSPSAAAFTGELAAAEAAARAQLDGLFGGGDADSLTDDDPAKSAAEDLFK